MNTSGEKLPSNVKAIVEDCGFTSTGDVFTYQLKQLFGLPKFPVPLCCEYYDRNQSRI
ncbi:hypothetical protein ICE98_02896 [Lactococcus lactis]|nr:hypothetical protein [Lactococcus lactis]